MVETQRKAERERKLLHAHDVCCATGGGPADVMARCSLAGTRCSRAVVKGGEDTE